MTEVCRCGHDEMRHLIYRGGFDMGCADCDCPEHRPTPSPQGAPDARP